ncbi:MAG: hypothetical protein AB7K68_00455 [Bacteriovoracia bacterium]
MNKIFSLIVFACSTPVFAAPMIAKDYWLKKHAPAVAEAMCEGNILRCTNLKREECAVFFTPAIQACGERMYDALPAYISGKEMAAKVSKQLTDCAMNDMREGITRKISANPKRIKKELCLEYVIPGAQSGAPAAPGLKVIR